MSNIIKFIRGAEADIPVLNQGEPAFTTDTHKVFIGDGAENHQLAMLDENEIVTGIWSFPSIVVGDASFNVFIGEDVGISNVSSYGTYNVVVGESAFDSNTYGSYNTALGYDVLGCNTEGNSNVALGYDALYENITGSNNVAVGFAAGMYGADGVIEMTSPENSIYIGADSKGKDNDDSNSIVIGYEAIGMGANTTVIGNSSTTNTYLFGEVTMTGSVDATKQIRFEVDGLTTSTTRVLTVPDKNLTLVGTVDKLSAFASTTSAELAGVISDETGSGALVFASSPSLVTPTISASRARAYLETTAQTITTSTATKLLLNAESYDNLGEFDSTTNYRFTATTAGYYAVSFSVLYVAATAAKTYSAYIYKNNSEVTRGQSQAATTGLNMIVNGSDIIYLNATNYLELFVWHNTGTDIDIYFGSPFTFMAVHRLS